VDFRGREGGRVIVPSRNSSNDLRNVDAPVLW
jgi:hypothetical protein